MPEKRPQEGADSDTKLGETNMSNAQIFLQSLLHLLIPLYHALCTPDFHLILQLSSSPSSSLCNQISTHVRASRINPHTIWKRPKRWRSSQPERRLLNQCATTRAGDNTAPRYAAVGFSLTCQLLLMRETTHTATLLTSARLERTTTVGKQSRGRATNIRTGGLPTGRCKMGGTKTGGKTG